ncbi:cytochrome b5 [Kineobactrum sediminis]|uniref:Cytochrome b5 n=1 Tax=Kineobactrum sediminis TaxID=1905677 RepID=A0A2N5XXT9_9GAMM|nr:cytochrome b5-like heme/steroid binding domain-containing protein [Kineobactrum sediminis]PLW80953.1 cytochrome b5 [Kineobactrum sediminis]
MKKFMFASFIAFWASLGTIAVLHGVGPQEATAESDEAQYTLDDVAEHDSLDDCWMAIEGTVYDVTDYVPRHPAPDSVIKPWCGKEATEGMRTKGANRDHSSMAWQMLEDYRIGVLAE